MINIKDYQLCVGAFGNAYIAKPSKKSPHIMCENRKNLSHEDVLAFIHQYVQTWCENNETNVMQITAGDELVMEIKAMALNEKGEIK